MEILANLAGWFWVAGMVIFATLSLLAIVLVLGSVVMGNRREFVFSETVEANGTIPERQPSPAMNPVAVRSNASVAMEPRPHGQKPIPAGA